ncbi:MAG TPA: DinB family protein, partial [Armatimonadota bacterium]|nr:DinB family protein [Armatimonadota bacterium]
MPTTGEALADQFDRCWEMLRSSARRISPDRWRKDDNAKLNPARWALHAVEAAEWYERDDPDGFPWGKRFGDWERGSADQLPTQDELIAYIDEVAATLGAHLRASTDEDLAAASPYPWTGETNIGRWVYTLRHTTFHAGEVDMNLRMELGPDEE